MDNQTLKYGTEFSPVRPEGPVPSEESEDNTNEAQRLHPTQDLASHTCSIWWYTQSQHENMTKELCQLEYCNAYLNFFSHYFKLKLGLVELDGVADKYDIS